MNGVLHRLAIALLGVGTALCGCEGEWLGVGLGVALLTWLVLEDSSPFEV